MASQPLRRDEPSRAAADLTQYWRDGYAIIRGFFSRHEIGEISDALDQLYAEGVAHGRCFRHGNLFYNVAREGNGEPLVRMVQWPSYHQPVLNSIRLDIRFAELLEPLIGYNLKQIINQVHWKARGSLGDFAWHQDSRFRRPASAYRNLATAYVQTGLAIDPHTPESGCMRLIPRSHLRGDLDMDSSKLVLGTAMSDDVLEQGSSSRSTASSTQWPTPATSPCGARIWYTDRARTARATSAGCTSTATCAPTIAIAASGRSRQAGRCRSDGSQRSSTTTSCTSGRSRITRTPEPPCAAIGAPLPAPDDRFGDSGRRRGRNLGCA